MDSLSDAINYAKASVERLINSNTNKNRNLSGSVNDEPIQSDLIGQFEDKLKEEEIIKLVITWTSSYSGYKETMDNIAKKNKQYYTGEIAGSDGAGGSDNIITNLIFEAEETFIPAALAKNPDPVVFAVDRGGDVKQLADTIKTFLQYHVDKLALRRKLTYVVRHWTICHLGCLKHGWNNETEDIDTQVIDTKNLILNDREHINEYGDYTGEYIGEKKHTSLGNLINLFKDKEEKIKQCVEVEAVKNNNLGTTIEYIEWWTKDYVFYTFANKVVLKKEKNPHWNYEEEIEENVDGVEEIEDVKKRNHFEYRKLPYTFMSVFSLMKQPHDETSLIKQNIPQQNQITKRVLQIDKNLDVNNNSLLLNEGMFNQSKAKEAAKAIRVGDPILVPKTDNVNNAVARLNAIDLPEAFFQQLENTKRDLRSSFGTEGLSSTNFKEQPTVRGKILNKEFDSSRINGGIGDALEQVADNVFNWWVQLYSVYYDTVKEASFLGQNKAMKFAELQSKNIDKKLIVTVAPNSLLPKDETTERNEAMELWSSGAIDPLSLFKKLNWSDPQIAAAQLMLYKTDPVAYINVNFPDIYQQIQASKILDLSHNAELQQHAKELGVPPAPPVGAPVGAQAPLPAQEGQEAPIIPDESLGPDIDNPNISNISIPKL